mmetsp:Transcript_41293/g.56282  ORF Transcript_41293/g.56282 Transcript_41293/m.56282 type:complete len:276 (+) Transcript_41293:127-954(+)
MSKQEEGTPTSLRTGNRFLNVHFFNATPCPRQESKYSTPPSLGLGHLELDRDTTFVVFLLDFMPSPGSLRKGELEREPPLSPLPFVVMLPPFDLDSSTLSNSPLLEHVDGSPALCTPRAGGSFSFSTPPARPTHADSIASIFALFASFFASFFCWRTRILFFAAARILSCSGFRFLSGLDLFFVSTVWMLPHSSSWPSLKTVLSVATLPGVPMPPPLATVAVPLEGKFLLSRMSTTHTVCTVTMGAGVTSVFASPGNFGDNPWVPRASTLPPAWT